ncbi:hypothetical protein SYNPS1DRAFT_30750 [Syncephalis pseudoplumigaleata]|uniref:Uncharacterized protein n=1 Tax=Syncephalis pseudoplumigaleata TaxID=1712513 RepID=A0A4P9YW64_9FUNG|nr:hypothetical protein SYNPS1DRAFT_30750 [Syncephalis pseudoplumigaleata]|eukprot:RKP23501.1 hypothetical protein SYNPS1DRAFT_30750 [Syncephalis pseudoplumigaleata]
MAHSTSRIRARDLKHEHGPQQRWSLRKSIRSFWRGDRPVGGDEGKSLVDASDVTATRHGRRASTGSRASRPTRVLSIDTAATPSTATATIVDLSSAPLSAPLLTPPPPLPLPLPSSSRNIVVDSTPVVTNDVVVVVSSSLSPVAVCAPVDELADDHNNNSSSSSHSKDNDNATASVPSISVPVVSEDQSASTNHVTATADHDGDDDVPDAPLASPTDTDAVAPLSPQNKTSFDRTSTKDDKRRSKGWKSWMFWQTEQATANEAL